MTEKHIIKFHFIAKFFGDTNRFLERGENAYISGHVISFQYMGNVRPIILKGEVAASMKKRNYSVEISYDLEEGIKEASCRCPRGNIACHHMAALLYHAHYNVSVTDIECQWRAPRTTKKSNDIIKLRDLINAKPYEACKRQANEDEVQRFKEALGQTNVVGFAWLLRSEPSEETTTLIPDIEEILQSREYVSAVDRTAFFKEKCQLTAETISQINVATEGQHANENWHVARKHRLTASKFGLVLAACHRQKFPPSLFKNLVEGYNLQRIAAVQWGKDHEKTALESFSQITELEIKPSGLWLDPCGYLGASPDGFVGEDAIIEVKCPFKYRETNSLLQEFADKSYLFWMEGDVVSVNGDHNYYHQIQGQLYLTNKSICHFVVWAPNDIVAVSIERDPNWINNVDILKDFYFNQYIPHICK